MRPALINTSHCTATQEGITRIRVPNIPMIAMELGCPTKIANFPSNTSQNYITTFFSGFLRHSIPSVLDPHQQETHLSSQLGAAVEVISAMRAQLPVPQWLVPLELVKRFLVRSPSSALIVVY